MTTRDTNTHKRENMLFTFEKKFTASYMMLLLVARELDYSPLSEECRQNTIYALNTYYGATLSDATEFVNSAQLRMKLTGGDDITMCITNQIKAVFAGEASILDVAEETNE
jgi:hypothetical protein